MAKFTNPPDITHLNITEEERRLAMLMHRRGKGLSSPQSAITPDQVDGLTAWYDDTSVLHTTGAVTAWNDKSGNDIHLDIVSGTPRFGDSQINGIDVVTFLSSSDEKITSTANLDITGSNPRTIFTVINRSSNDIRYLWAWGDINGGTGELFALAGDFGLRILGANVRWGKPITGEPELLLLGSHSGLVIGDYLLYEGSTPLAETGSNNPLTPVATAVGPLTVGANSAAAGEPSCFSGDIAEVVIYNRQLTQAEYVGINDYLKDKWGMSTLQTGGVYFQ